MVSVADVRRVFDARSSQYNACRVRVAWLRESDGGSLLRGAVDFTRQAAGIPTALDYGSLVLEEKYLLPAEGLDFLQQLCERNGLLKGFGFSPIKDPEWSQPAWYRPPDFPVPVGTARFSEWPARVFVVAPLRDTRSDPYGPLVRPGLPLLADPRTRIDEWTSMDWRWIQRSNAVLVRLPDYRVRIVVVRFTEREIEVETEYDAARLKPEDTEVRASLQHGNNFSEVAVTREKTTYRLMVDRVPTTLYFVIMDPRSGEVLDWAQVDPRRSAEFPEIVFSLPGLQVSQMIDGGESEEVEFKSKLADGHTLIQSIVAFANTNGGTILVGVQDDGIIVGGTVPEDGSRIQEWIETRCDPPVSVDLETVVLDGKRVLVVRVPTGSNPPYQHRANGVVYVRRGATDRPVRRSELDAFYRRDRATTGWRGP